MEHIPIPPFYIYVVFVYIVYVYMYVYNTRTGIHLEVFGRAYKIHLMNFVCRKLRNYKDVKINFEAELPQTDTLRIYTAFCHHIPMVRSVRNTEVDAKRNLCGLVNLFMYVNKGFIYHNFMFGHDSQMPFTYSPHLPIYKQ